MWSFLVHLNHQKYYQNIMRDSLSFKSHSQVNEYEVMTLGQLDLIFYLFDNIKS